MKSAITVAAIAIATIVNRSGWVASRNVDGLDSVTSLAALTAMRRIVAADSGPCDAHREQKAYSGSIACANRKLHRWLTSVINLDYKRPPSGEFRHFVLADTRCLR